MPHNPQYTLLCEAASSSAPMMGTAEGEAALAMLDPAGEYARINDLEEDLDALSERELETLAMECNKLLTPSCSTSDLRSKLQSYRSVVSRDPNQHVRLGSKIDALRAKMKLKHMQSNGQNFQKQAANFAARPPMQQQHQQQQASGGISFVGGHQAQRHHRSQSQRCAEALQTPAASLHNPATAQHLQPGFSQQLQAERQPAQTQSNGKLSSLRSNHNTFPLGGIRQQPVISRPPRPAGQPQLAPEALHRLQHQMPSAATVASHRGAAPHPTPPSLLVAKRHKQQQPSSLSNMLVGAFHAGARAVQQLAPRASTLLKCLNCQQPAAEVKQVEEMTLCNTCLAEQQRAGANFQGFIFTRTPTAPKLKLKRLPQGHPSAAAAAPAAARVPAPVGTSTAGVGAAMPARPAAKRPAASTAAAQRRAVKASNKPGDKDAPIVLDSDEDEDDGVLAVADGAAAAAAAADEGSTDSEAAAAANARRRRSQRINLVTAGPGTTQKFLGLRCLFPSAGGRGAVEVVAEDLARLDPDEFLNDTIIDYYIKKIELSLPPDGRRRCHFFNSFFFKKLTEKTANGSGNGRGARKADQEEVARQNWERVKKWTKGVDVFQKDFLFVPIHDVLHWSLAIICHPALLPEVAAASHGGEAAATAWGRLPAAQAAAAAAEARATAVVATACGGSQLEDEQLGHGPESAGAAAVAAVTAATLAKKPVILHLDSMSSGHTSPAVGRALGQYLEQEWAHRHDHLSHHHHGSNQQQQAQPRRTMGPQTQAAAAAEAAAADAQPDAGAGEACGGASSQQPEALKINTSGQKGKYGNCPCIRLQTIPSQDNHCDCGLFVLTYLELFVFALPAAVSPEVVNKKDVPPLSEADPHLLQRSWFHPALASVLRGQLRFELLELMIEQAVDRSSMAVSAAVEERDEYKQQWDEQQQRLRNNTPGGILAYVAPAQYRAAHQLLERHLQLQEAEKSAARRASKSRQQQQQQQQQLKLEHLALDQPRQLTNAERRREEQRAAAASAAEQREGATAGVREDQAVAEAFPGPEVDMQGEEEEDQERERFYSPAAEFEEDEKGKEPIGARPADSGKHSSRHHSTLAGKDPANWEDGKAVQGGRPTSSGGAPADGAVAAAAAAEDNGWWQAVDGDASEDADDVEVKPSARKARAAAEQRQRRQLRQSKRRRTSEQQQRQQSDVHPEQEEDAIDEDVPLAQVAQQFRRQQQQQPAENRQHRQQQQQHKSSQQQRRRSNRIIDDAGGSEEGSESPVTDDEDMLDVGDCLQQQLQLQQQHPEDAPSVDLCSDEPPAPFSPKRQQQQRVGMPLDYDEHFLQARAAKQQQQHWQQQLGDQGNAGVAEDQPDRQQQQQQGLGMEEEEEQLFNEAMSIISAWSGQQQHRPHDLQRALWKRFNESYGYNLAAALAPGPTSRAHTVTEEDRKTMLELFVQTLGQQLHINMLVPLVQALQCINESQTTARHEQVEVKQLQRHQWQHAAAAAAAAAAPSGKGKRRSNATGSPAAAAAVDPKQQKLPGMMDKWCRGGTIAYELGRTRQPQDVQKLFNTVTRLDREQQQEAEQQLNLDLNPADSGDSMQHNQPADVCNLVSDDDEPDTPEVAQQQQQHAAASDISLHTAAPSGGGQGRLQAPTAPDPNTWASNAAPLGDAQQQRQNAGFMQASIRSAVNSLVAIDGPQQQQQQQQSPPRQQQRQQLLLQSPVADTAGRVTRQSRRQQQQQPSPNPMAVGGAALQELLHAKQELSLQDQPEANLPLMASGAVAFKSARSRECRAAQGGALTASRQQQQLTPGPLHHVPVCFDPPAQPLVDYASESRGSSDRDPELLPTQPVDAAGGAGGGLGEATSPIQGQPAGAAGAVPARGGSGRSRQAASAADAAARLSGRLPVLDAGQRLASGGQNLQAAMAAVPITLQQLHNRSPGSGRGQRSKVATTALAKEAAAASAIHIDSSDDGGS